MTEPTQPCGFCGMPCAANEYHPYAACLTFKACHNSETVRANLEAVRGTPAPVGVGEVAEHYRNAIASACEGWTMPDGLRKHLETALWSPPTSQPTQPQAGAVPLTPDQVAEIADAAHREYDRLVSSGQCAPRWSAAFAHLLEMHHGIKGGQHGTDT